jgi:putative ABC transport system permease protein
VGAELYVAQRGARNFIGATSQLPAATVATVSADPDVEWAVPVGLVARAYKVPLTVMRGVAFAVGSLVIALTTYSAIVERSREYGIVKAIGARERDLIRIALAHSMIISFGGLLAGAVFFVLGRAVITYARPQFAIVATTENVGRAAGAAVLMAILASAVPARRLIRLEPATAYRGG